VCYRVALGRGRGSNRWGEAATCALDGVCYVPSVFLNQKIGNMKKLSILIVVTGVVAALQIVRAGDITGTVTLKGTPPKEKEITPVMEDVNCSKLHTTVPTTHFYVVGGSGGLADVVVSLEGISGKSTGASAPPFVLDQKGCEYVPSIFAVQTGQAQPQALFEACARVVQTGLSEAELQLLQQKIGGQGQAAPGQVPQAAPAQLRGDPDALGTQAGVL